MKATALLMVFCVLLLSALPGKTITVQGHIACGCCRQMAANPVCSHQQHQKDDCQRACQAMLLCSTCGFLVTELLHLEISAAGTVKKQLLPYQAGKLSDFSAFNWRPPQV